MLPRTDRIRLVGKDEIVRGGIVRDDARRRGIHESRDTSLLARVNDTVGAVDIDLLVEGVVGTALGEGRRRRGMDDDVGAHLRKDRGQAGHLFPRLDVRRILKRGNVAVKIAHAILDGAPVSRRRQVEHGNSDGLVLGRGEQQINNVMAQESAAANDQDAAQRSGFGGGSHEGVDVEEGGGSGL